MGGTTVANYYEVELRTGLSKKEVCQLVLEHLVDNDILAEDLLKS